MAKTKTRSSSKKSTGAGDSSSKRRKITIRDESSSNQASLDSLPSQTPVHVTRGSSKVLNKQLMKERFIDVDLLNRIGVIDLFKNLGCESLLFPPRLVYPLLVREFYSNFQLLGGDVVYSMVKDIPIVFKADCLARVIEVSDSVPCPFTTYQPFTDILKLQYEDQLQLILGDNYLSTSVKPLVSNITPLSLLFFKLFHTNLLPRKSGRDRITFQDSILLYVFLSGFKFNTSLFIIRNMSHCSSHDSMHLPYPALLTNFFQYFNVISESDLSENLTTVFYASTLAANNLVVNSENVLVFGSLNRSVPFCLLNCVKIQLL